jgi:hypothetical protein
MERWGWGHPRAPCWQPGLLGDNVPNFSRGSDGFIFLGFRVMGQIQFGASSN